MREIKFRAWNAELKKMYKLAKVDYLGSHGILDHYIGCYDAIWMEYTGLKDRNGKEIFEGDIVSILTKEPSIHFKDDEQWINNHTIKCTVVYTDAKFVFDAIEHQEWWKGWNKDVAHWKESATVIGNIYQNPQLLQSQTELTPTNSTVNSE